MSGVLAYASYHDIRKRQVPDSVWYIAAIVGGLVLVYGLTIVPSYFMINLPQMILVAGVGVALLILPLFGKPDSLAIIYMGIMVPELIVFNIGQSLLFAPFAFVVLISGLALSLSETLRNLSSNMRWKLRKGPLYSNLSASLPKKLLILLIARKISHSSISGNNFVIPIQSGRKLSKIRDMISIQSDDLGPNVFQGLQSEPKSRDTKSNSLTLGFREHEEPGVWVQRILPFFPYLLLGLLVVILGDNLGIIEILKIEP
ncbi:MAG: hypothetical protein ACE5KG_05805 [Nitrososphaerales archaeon]